MQFQIASDLHIEQYSSKDSMASEFIQPSADVLILAGDVGSMYRRRQLTNFLEDVCNKFQWVIYVPGNHEYYSIKSIPTIPMSRFQNFMKKLCAQITNLIFLDREVIEIDNIRVIGATLWSKISIEPRIVRIPCMNQNRYNGYHRRDLAFLRKEIKAAKWAKKKILVVTHHPPIEFFSSTDKYHELYSNSLEELMEDVNVWIYGHTHKNSTRIIGKTQVISNQKGKIRDNVNDYKKNCLIRI